MHILSETTFAKISSAVMAGSSNSSSLKSSFPYKRTARVKAPPCPPRRGGFWEPEAPPGLPEGEGTDEPVLFFKLLLIVFVFKAPSNLLEWEEKEAIVSVLILF
jgi:hypothetical protein